MQEIKPVHPREIIIQVQGAPRRGTRFHPLGARYHSTADARTHLILSRKQVKISQ